MAIAQRSSAQVRYWRGLISDIFLGFTMRNVLEVLQKDIDNVWNMDDPEKSSCLALLSALVGRSIRRGEATNNYPLTEKAVQAIIQNPAAIIIAGPTAVVVLFAEWVRGTFKKTIPGKSSVRCLVAFIIDLTLTMDTFALWYNSCKGPVHANIKAWVDGWGTFSGHLDADVVIKKITDIIMDNSAKPEQWAMTEEGFDESWMPIEALREN
ncbi:hypothetical protein B0H14DRAFT_3007863 [Mycena olivaceomarginata]|nr:hypothetical protein B0H14DRAFT_3007863 [Mycena olivaceomarginata]